MPLQSTSGAASYDAFGGGVAVVPKYIEDVFSTFLWSGNGSAITINNGIDLSTKGGLVWVKARNQGARNHWLQDTARGITNTLNSDTTGAQNALSSNIVSSVTTTGFVDGASWPSGWDMASWSWAKAPKFFDVVTLNYTSGAAVFNHSLGSVPGFVIVKVFDGYADNWWVYHRSLGNNQYLSLNLTSQAQTSTGIFSATDTTFTVKNGIFSASTIVAYLFAHDAGGFGLTGTDNVISCGSYTGNGSTTGPVITLGYEPQWLMVKKSSGSGDWVMLDNMRGIVTDGIDPRVWANLSSAENTGDFLFKLNATGFQPESLSDSINASSQTYIYIAIRRGPMKVPTSGTSVFNTALRTTGNPNFVAGFPIDMSIYALRSGAAGTPLNISRLTNTILVTSNTSAETANDPSLNYDQQLGYGSGQSTNSNVLSWMWKRAPSFFDEVCVTPSYPTPVTHNLGAVPKLRFEKTRSITAEWKAIYFDGTTDEYELALNSTRAASLQSGRPGLPTSTSFIAYYDGTPIVAYLFAPVPGVQYISKFTGNGSSQTINCGFTGGARFICIKAFSTTGDWKVIDTARGIVSGNDPTLAFNTTSAEVTGTDCIDPDSSGFIVNQESTNNLNVNGVEYLVWAIA